MKSIAITVCLYFLMSGSYAQNLNVEGTYSSDTTHLQVIVLDSERGIVAAKASVSHGHCSGTLAGLGEVKGRRLTIEPYVKLEEPERCHLIVEFDSKWRNATLTENSYCAAFHGASCSWEGQSVRKKVTKP